MSTFTKQNTDNNGVGHNTRTQRPEQDRKDMICWGCGGIGHGWRECATPRKNNYLPFKPEILGPLPTSNREESTSLDNKGKLGCLWN